MHFSFCIILLLTAAAIAARNPKPKCPYKDTVDLTNQTRFDNGSYIYNGIVIPEDQCSLYDYHLKFRNISKVAATHVRGCVCDASKRRYCVKLCCERDYVFNEKSSSCQKISENFSMPTHLKLGHDKSEVNIFEHFVYQVGFPCENLEVLQKKHAWHLQENGLLHVKTLGEDDILDTVSYCMTPYLRNGSNEFVFMPASCPMKVDVAFADLLNTYSMAISVIFLVPTILVYLLVKELRRNLRGKLLICYLSSMTVGYSLVSFLNISRIRFGVVQCSCIGFIGYFYFMSAFMWLSVLCIDISINFKETNFEFDAKQNLQRFIIYSLYAWGSAGLMTGILVWAQLSNYVAESFKPGIGYEICWLDTRKWSAALYFYGPNLLILTFNIITFTQLTIRIYKVRRDVARMTHKEKFFRENAIVILRLFLVMGVSWFWDILSYTLRNFSEWYFLFFITDFCNSIQGVLIFLFFVLKRKILDELKKIFGFKSVRAATNSQSSGSSKTNSTLFRSSQSRPMSTVSTVSSP